MRKSMSVAADTAVMAQIPVIYVSFPHFLHADLGQYECER